MTSYSGIKNIVTLIPLALLSILFIFLPSSYSSIAVTPAIIASVLGMYYSSDVFVDQAETLGKKLNITGKSTGLIIVSLGSITDEIFVSITAGILGYDSISFGNIMGSNIVTIIAFIPLIIIFPLKKARTFLRDGFFLIISILILTVMSEFFPKFPRELSLPLLLLFLLYVIIAGEKNPVIVVKEKNTSPILMLFALLTIFVSSYSLVRYSLLISHSFNIPLFESGFIVTGIGGSLPEIFMGVVSLARERRDMAMGVLLGSSIAKITLLPGIIAGMGVLTVTGGIWSEYLFMALVCLSLLLMEIRGL